MTCGRHARNNKSLSIVSTQRGFLQGSTTNLQSQTVCRSLINVLFTEVDGCVDCSRELGMLEWRVTGPRQPQQLVWHVITAATATHCSQACQSQENTTIASTGNTNRKRSKTPLPYGYQNPNESSSDVAAGSSNTLDGGGDSIGLAAVGERGRSATTRLLLRRRSARGSGTSSFRFVAGVCFKNSQFRTAKILSSEEARGRSRRKERTEI